jgi:glutamyl-tRNA synthetase
VADALARIPAADWHSERILADLKALAESRGAKLGDLLQPVRVVLTGSTVSEPVNDLLVVVGREQSLARLHAGTTD